MNSDISRHLVIVFFSLIVVGSPQLVSAQETRLLQQPSLSADSIAFAYGGDLWLVNREGGTARRITSTPAVENDPHFSPDGRWLAFSSNRSGVEAVYVVPVEGGTAKRLTWYPADSSARGWSPDGSHVLYASSRNSAPTGYRRLWTVSPDGGPSELLQAPMAYDGSYAPDRSKIVVDRVSRWDSEWRHYRGGQNTPLVILDLADLSEIHLPSERTIEIQPLWMNNKVYFLSDRSWSMNIFSFDPATNEITQLTDYTDVDVKWLGGRDGVLIFERDGWFHLFDIASDEIRKVEITVNGDFPWADPQWKDVSDDVQSASLSATGKRALFEARGEIFTVPAEKGDARNITRSSGAADRAPVWSPDGAKIAWFSDAGDGYELLIAPQDGLSEPQRLSIGESVMAWEPVWSPDGSQIAFIDDDTRVQVIDLESGTIVTADVGGANIDRGSTGLCWSPDSKWLAFNKTFSNSFHRIIVWSKENNRSTTVTNPLADAVSPSWDRDGRYLYFMASTNLALASGWANTSTVHADPTYAVYAIVLRNEDPSPFVPESDEEPAEKDDQKDKDSEPADDGDKKGDDEKPAVEVRIDFDGIERRTLALPMPSAPYLGTIAGAEGSVFVGEDNPDGPGMTLHLFKLKDREAEVFVKKASQVSVSADGKKLLYRSGKSWRIVGTDDPPPPDADTFEVSLQMHLDPRAEWQQIFDEAWHYQRDFFYDPDMHGRDWQVVRERYAPLVPFVQHRADLNLVLDRMSGEMSVGHSFVGGGDFPETEESRVGLLGADLVADQDHWKIKRIFTFESWNPELSAPFDRPGLEVSEGDYILAINGVELTAEDDPYRLLDGTTGRQTMLHVNDTPSMEGARRVVVEPTDSERTLRQLAWVEDNRRRVDELSDGKLAYVWVPNTSTRGVISFNRYFFAQQDKKGAVIDERFNGGGSLDDYMVDLMIRKLRAAITNEVPGGAPFPLPAGILGPKVLLINELAGSGGDYFPWVFRHQGIGPLIGARTWGGLVKSSVHYPFVDGGAMTAPDNAVFDPEKGEWIAENKGVPPDIEVLLDAKTVAEGRDPQLERGVAEALRMLEEQGTPTVTPPPYSKPAARPK